jgi:hypothetical protein
MTESGAAASRDHAPETPMAAFPDRFRHVAAAAAVAWAIVGGGQARAAEPAAASHPAAAAAAVNVEDVPLRTLRATVKLADRQRGSTGFLVAVPDIGDGPPRIALVTAAHALTGVAGESCTAVFRAKAGGDGFERREVTIRVRDGEKRLFTRHPTADVAVIGVVPPPDADWQPFARGDIADVPRIETGIVRAGRRVWVACYPAQVAAHPAGWPILRHGTIASHPLLPVAAVPTFFLDYSHFGGDSGSAAVIDVEGTPVIAGVVVGMQRQTDRTVSPFEERTMHTPLDLAVTVHPLLVAETIDAWAAAK